MKVLITGPFDKDELNNLESRGIEVVQRPANVSDDDLTAAIADVQGYILLGNECVTADVIRAAKALKAMVFPGEQAETSVSKEAKSLIEERGIVLLNTPGVSTNAVAEFTCGLILCAARRIPYLVSSTQEGQWPQFTGEELSGTTLGIYGMGKIGSAVVKRMFSFEFRRILYTDRHHSESAERDFGARKVSLEQLFQESDVVSLHAPLTDQTHGIVGEKLLRSMKSTSVLINTSRAGLVDPQALRTALREEWLSSAAFDGYYIEGYDFTKITPDHDPYGLLELHDRFYVASHQAFNTSLALKSASEVAVQKLLSNLLGEEQQAA